MTGGSLRHDANVLTITGIEADYDAEQVSFDEAVERLTGQGVLSMVYTSPSHTVDRQRWRVLCPFSAPATPDVRPKMLGRLNGLYRGIFASESWTLSQSYYFGSVNSSSSHRVVVIDGTPIDEHDDLDVTWMGKPNTGPETAGLTAATSGPVNEGELVEQIVSGDSYHAAAVRLLGRWAINRVPLMEARRRLVAAMEVVFPPDRGDRWHARYADIDRCVFDIYGKEADKRDRVGDQPRTGDQTPDSGEPRLSSRKAGRTDSSAITWSEPVDFLADNVTASPLSEGAARPSRAVAVRNRCRCPDGCRSRQRRARRHRIVCCRDQRRLDGAAETERRFLDGASPAVGRDTGRTLDSEDACDRRMYEANRPARGGCPSSPRRCCAPLEG